MLIDLPLVFFVSISKPAHDSERPFELERIVFFSDAVFAIAITLLAIELKVPDLGEHQTNETVVLGILAQWSHLFAFALSFWIIAIFWLTHHRYFRHIKNYDAGLTGRNLLILFFVALMPFSTSIMGEYGNIAAGLWLYAFNMFFLGLSGAWLWNHASHKHRLVDPDLDDTVIRSVFVRAFTTPAAAVIVFALSFFIGGFANFGWSLIYLFQILVIRYYKQPNL